MHVFGDQGSVESLSETQLIVRKTGAAIDRREVPASNSVFFELEAFAHAAKGGAAFPISTAEIIDTAAAFEAILKSISTGNAVAVQQKETT